MSGLFKNCQHNPLHTAPPSALSVNHRPPCKPAAKAKISPSTIQQHRNATEPVLLRAENEISVSWIIWRQQYLFSNGRDGSPTIKSTTYAVRVNLAVELIEKPAKSIP